MGIVYQIQGKLKEALQHHQQALKIHREISNKKSEADDLGNMGIVYRIQGKLKEALQHYQQALKIHREIGDKEGEAGDLSNMGIVYQILGKLEKALNKFKDALEIFEALGSSRKIEKTTKIIKIVEEEIKNKVVDDIIQNNQEKNKIKENTKKSEIFLSYSHKNKDIADRVDKFFISKNIRLKRDVRDVPAYSSLTKFMDTIRDHDYVIMLISDAYLKSTNCMYEVIQFIREKKYIEKIFPIIIDKKADIFNRVKHIDYISFWQKKYKCFRDKINKLENTGTVQSHVELDKIDKIQSNIGEFLDKIVELKCILLDELENTNYKAILDKISKTFDIPQKEEVKIKSDKLKLRTDDKRATNSAIKTIALTEPVPLGTPITKDGIIVIMQRIEVVEPPLCVEPFGVEIYFSVINNSERVLKSGLLGPATGSLFYVLDEEIYEDEFNAIGYNHIGDAISWVYPGQSRSVGYRKCFHSPVTIKQITWTGTFADDQTEIELGPWEN